MPRAAKLALFTTLLLGCLALSSPAQARGAEAIVWVADDGGLGVETAKSARRRRVPSIASRSKSIAFSSSSFRRRTSSVLARIFSFSGG